MGRFMSHHAEAAFALLPASYGQVGGSDADASRSGKANGPMEGLTDQRPALSSLNHLWEHKKPAS